MQDLDVSSEGLRTSTRSFRYWRLVSRSWSTLHPGNAVETAAGNPNPITAPAELDNATALSMPSDHPMRRWEDTKETLGYLGRLGDPTNFVALPAAVQALASAANVTAEQRRLGFTVVQIAHRLETLKDSDLVFYFEGGRIVAQRAAPLAEGLGQLASRSAASHGGSARLRLGRSDASRSDRAQAAGGSAAACGSRRSPSPSRTTRPSSAPGGGSSTRPGWSPATGPRPTRTPCSCATTARAGALPRHSAPEGPRR